MKFYEFDGARMVLWAPDESLRAMRVVDLFLILAHHVGYEMELDTVTIPTRKLHEHFDSFVEAIELDRDFTTDVVLPLYPGRTGDIRYPAVDLYETAFQGPEGSVLISHIIDTRFEPKGQKGIANIVEMASRVRVSYKMRYQDLVSAARTALEKMNALHQKAASG